MKTPLHTRYAVFQSTHPLRGATVRLHGAIREFIISIHAPLAGCDLARHQLQCRRQILISIHAPLAGCDQLTPENVGAVDISIHAPLAGCDQKAAAATKGICISIHAPLAGCDITAENKKEEQDYFNPRTPCGVRRSSASAGRSTAAFQSTHPLRGATFRGRFLRHRADISIHAPLAGCDSKSAQKNAALLRKRYKYKFFVCKKCTSGDLTGAYSSKNTLYSGANCSENPCALSVRTHRISGPSTSNPGLMPKCSILERYFSPR